MLSRKRSELEGAARAHWYFSSASTRRPARASPTASLAICSTRVGVSSTRGGPALRFHRRVELLEEVRQLPLVFGVWGRAGLGAAQPQVVDQQPGEADELEVGGEVVAAFLLGGGVGDRAASVVGTHHGHHHVGLV